jgi:hypothetical protein
LLNKKCRGKMDFQSIIAIVLIVPALYIGYAFTKRIAPIRYDLVPPTKIINSGGVGCFSIIAYFLLLGLFMILGVLKF